MIQVWAGKHIHRLYSCQMIKVLMIGWDNVARWYDVVYTAQSQRVCGIAVGSCFWILLGLNNNFLCDFGSFWCDNIKNEF